ncbi:hypothetical protein NH8B_1481 [Pseudogulbenkiania sp. NH8B]|uniref:Uncharacterized protein n=1 Tax=Pseudogulbenkiania ferrooxidans 2002 TaxID=279714 RepID=B9Z2W3_9NEIS|nr:MULTISPECIES: hypothetical protein [Pseudogulbenkiania]EEG08916.1 conserved hypothetical protein [Pseudogulbenkiania ferrooxidans 2002]BAK76303.1 hypothetical protein NH8B_1481 [Pseudogulbenkiania sp. NH8B]
MDHHGLLRQLETLALPEADFNHEAHLLAAWAYRRQYPAREAAARCARTLSRYAMAKGAAHKYHHTLTMAALAILYSRLDAKPELLDDWPAFLACCPDVRDDLPSLLRQHYSEEKLHDETARRAFVAPDLKPLPASAMLH